MPETASKAVPINRIWHLATAPFLKMLKHSREPGLHDHDSVAWYLQQTGLLVRGELDQLDLTNIINHFDRMADDLIRAWRDHCREVHHMLLLLWIAPSADAVTRIEWNDSLGKHRLEMEHLLRNNPSMKPFVPAMVDFAWHGGRCSAARTMNRLLYVDPPDRNRILERQREKGDWKERLPKDCPWDRVDIVGYDPDNDREHLFDPCFRPFYDPFFPARNPFDRNAE